MQDCIFCKIAKRDLEADVVYENDLVIAFKDANPVAKVHILIMPKEHIKNLYELAKHPRRDLLLGAVTEAAAEIADKFDSSDGFRLITNNGKAGGQSVFHLHFHLIGGQELGEKLV